MPPSLPDFVTSARGPSVVLSFVVLATALPIFYVVSKVIYNAFFHPLSSFPGPKSNAISNLPLALRSIGGRGPTQVFQLHQKYGDIVRTGPNDLTFSNPKAWNDIMGHRKQGEAEMGKDWRGFGPMDFGCETIIVSSRETHTRFRRILSRAFSEKAMRDQEPLIRGYVDLLIQRMHENSRTKVDLVAWYNFATFDIIGDLAFGEPFGCLQGSTYHPWVSFIFSRFKMGAYMIAARRFPILKELLVKMMPSAIKRSSANHRDITIEKVNKRLATDTTRPDFMSEIVKQDGEKGMSLSEKHANSSVLIIAGSETTATLLSGVTFHLLRNPTILAKLVEEIRTSFQSEEEITLLNVGHLTYLLAVLQEALRIYPPVPTGLPRMVPPQGGYIAGKFVPGGTSVSIFQAAINKDPTHWYEPDHFHPERWLGTDARFANDHLDAMQPFHVGPRNCIGKNLAYAEMRLILARMIWNFDMHLCEESQTWDQQNVFLLWAKKPLNVVLTPRSKA